MITIGVIELSEHLLLDQPALMPSVSVNVRFSLQGNPIINRGSIVSKKIFIRDPANGGGHITRKQMHDVNDLLTAGTEEILSYNGLYVATIKVITPLIWIPKKQLSNSYADDDRGYGSIALLVV